MGNLCSANSDTVSQNKVNPETDIHQESVIDTSLSTDNKKDNENVNDYYNENNIKLNRPEREYSNRIQIENSRMISRITNYQSIRNKLRLINLDHLQHLKIIMGQSYFKDDNRL
jgi:hypothetical protein